MISLPVRLLITLCFSLWLAGCDPGDSRPQLTDSHGNRIDTTGHWLAVNYWATWCKPCRVEVPEFNRLHGELQGQPVLMLGINFDELEDESLQEAAASLGIEFPVLTSESARQLKLPGTTGLPATLIVDPAGRLRARLLGEQNRDHLVSALQQLQALPDDF